jgi:hypothetical protein
MRDVTACSPLSKAPLLSLTNNIFGTIMGLPQVAMISSLRPLRSALRSLVRPEGCNHLAGGSPARAMVGWPGSWQAVRLGNWLYRSPATKAASGGRATRRAVT